jgi:hypothetical protein
VTAAASRQHEHAQRNYARPAAGPKNTLEQTAFLQPSMLAKSSFTRARTHLPTQSCCPSHCTNRHHGNTVHR